MWLKYHINLKQKLEKLVFMTGHKHNKVRNPLWQVIRHMCHISGSLLEFKRSIDKCGGRRLEK